MLFEAHDAISVDEKRRHMTGDGDFLDATIRDGGARAPGLVWTPAHHVVAHRHHQGGNVNPGKKVMNSAALHHHRLHCVQHPVTVGVAE